MLWIVSFFINLWPIIFLTLFCIGNTFILSFKRYFDAPIDIELSTFAAILMTMKYGLNIGLLAAFFTKFSSMMYNKKIKVAYFFMMSSYFVAAIFTYLIGGSNPVILGLIVTVISNIYLVLIRKFVTRYSSFEIISYGISNFLFNLVLFLGFADIFYALMV